MRSSAKKPSLKKVHFLENEEHPWFLPVNRFLGFVTLVSVATVALETVSSLSPYAQLFAQVEYVAVGIFTLEYILRVCLADKPIRYVFSWFGFVDLLAVIPSYLGFANLTFLKVARTVRIIRFLRMLRLAKFATIKRQKHAAESLYVFNLEIYFFALLFATLILGTLFYLFETTTVTSIPMGMFIGLKAVLGGLSYPQPETLGGTITLITARFTSMILLGMLVGLMGNIVRKLLIGAEKDS
jgi:hypothetical protein